MADISSSADSNTKRVGTLVKRRKLKMKSEFMQI